MNSDVSERSFEEAIECGLLQFGPDARIGAATAFRETSPSYGDTPPGGYGEAPDGQRQRIHPDSIPGACETGRFTFTIGGGCLTAMNPTPLRC